MINLGLLFRRRKLLPLSVSQLRWRWRRETSPRRSERASDERERTCHFELRAEGRVSAASEIQRRQYFILKGRTKRRAKGREGGFWGISPQIPKTQRQNGRRQNREWEQGEKIGPLSLSLSLRSSLLCFCACDDEQPTDRHHNYGTAAAAAKKKKKSICFCGRKGTEAEGEGGKPRRDRREAQSASFGTATQPFWQLLFISTAVFYSEWKEFEKGAASRGFQCSTFVSCLAKCSTHQ